MTGQEWEEFSKQVVDEANPDGWDGFFNGQPYYGVTLDEQGDLKLLEYQQNGVPNPGRLVKLLGIGGKLPSVAVYATKIVSKLLTKNMLRTGTSANRRIIPPGFTDGTVQARGHLIANVLGGSGNTPRNLTTLWSNANYPVMRRFEAEVQRAVEAGQTVRYQVTPIYRGSELIPRGVTMRAIGSGTTPLSRHITVLNLK